MSNRTTSVSVTREIVASPEHLYALVADLPRMGEWSPDNDGGEWVKGTPGSVGAAFKGRNHRGRRRWSTIAKVAIAEPGREFAFDVSATGVAVARWGFRFEPADGATKVTQYWEDHRSTVAAFVTGLAVGVRDRAVYNRASMEQTLDALAVTASTGAPR